MSFTNILNVLSVLVTVIGFVGCVWFIADYHLRTGGAWINYDAGRFLMADRFVLASILLLFLLTRIFGAWPGRQVITLLLFFIYMVFSWWPVLLLHRAPGVEPKDRKSVPDLGEGGSVHTRTDA